MVNFSTQLFFVPIESKNYLGSLIVTTTGKVLPLEKQDLISKDLLLAKRDEKTKEKADRALEKVTMKEKMRCF